MEYKVVDGFFVISQDRGSGRITFSKYGETIREIESKRLLSMDELHNLLIEYRTNYFMGGSEDEKQNL